MKKLLVLGSLLATSFMFANNAQAQTVCEEGEIPINNGEDCFNLLAAQNDPDPFGSYNLSFRDFGSPSTFNVKLSYLIAPTINELVDITASLAGSLTDGAFSPNGVSITPVDSKGVVTYALTGPGGSIPLDFGLGDGQTFTAGPPNSHTYGAFDETEVAAQDLVYDCGSLTGGCTGFDIMFKFTGSGGRDRASFTGRLDILPQSGPFGSLASHEIFLENVPLILSINDQEAATFNLVRSDENSDVFELLNGEIVPEPSANLVLISLGLFGLPLVFRKKLDS